MLANVLPLSDLLTAFVMCCCELDCPAQRTWAYLESLFISSEEVKKELPEATQQFVKIDADVKSVLAGFRQTQNCVECCGKDGLLKFLEKQQSELEVGCVHSVVMHCASNHSVQEALTG